MLAAYRVLDLSDERGLLCGQILADLGADVIAVEPAGGSTARRVGPFYQDRPDPNGSLFWWALSRNKRSATLDLESEAGQRQLRELAATADLLIESFAPGSVQQQRLGIEALRRLNPRLIVVSISAFGQQGPKAAWAATDLTALAASGALLISGDEDRPPLRVSVPQAFLHAGAEAAVAALIALAARERDGLGRHVDVSAQTATMMATQSYILSHGWGERQLQRSGVGVNVGPLELQLIYPASDGYVSLLVLFGSAIGPYTRRLLEWMHEEGYVDDATRDKDWLNYTALLLSGQEPVSELRRVNATIARFTATKSKAELFQAALERRLLLVPASTAADTVNSEQLAARGYWEELEHPELGCSVRYPGPFARFSAAPIRYRRRAPLLGEDTAEVLGWARETAKASPASTGAAQADGRALPLAGLKVLDFSWVMAGPASVRYLADWGATVVHVESTTHIDAGRTIGPFKDAQAGPERSGLYANVNAGKLGITLNLSTPEGRAVARRLAAWADVVVEGYSPRAMRAWGLNYEALRDANPSLIMLSTCLNGQTGPLALLAGYGTMGSALAGFVELAGWPDRGPAGPAGAYTDYVTPKFTAAALLAALEHRRRTGEGQYIDFSQTEAGIHFLAPVILDYTVNGRVSARVGNASPEHAPHGVYPAAGEDRWVAIACATDEQWQALCAAAGRPKWAADPRFVSFSARQQHREALDEALADWTRERDVDAIEQALQAVAVPSHRVSASADAFADPQVAFRRHFITVEHPLFGPVPIEAARALLSDCAPLAPWPGPVFGQHTEQVLRDLLGMGDEEIAELTVSGALE